MNFVTRHIIYMNSSGQHGEDGEKLGLWISILYANSLRSSLLAAMEEAR